MTVFQMNNIVEEALHPKQDRYAIYLRKSRADMELEAMGEGETLARHQKMLTALASRHEIHPDQITIYKEVVSGDSLDERPQMQQLLSDVYAKKFKAVLVVEIERLARGSTKDQGEVADAFQSTGTKIITPLKIYDPAIESDQEYFEFGLFMSRREYKTINRRQQSGKHQSVREGNYILPQRVFGYEIVRLTKRDRTLKPIPDEVKLVQMIFDWYTEDRRTTGWIARHMTLMGIPTIKNRPEWNRGTIRDMLSNPIYIGKVTWGKRKTVKEFDPELGKLVKVVKENGEQEIYEGKHPGIISNEQFEKAQWVTEIGKNPSAKISTELINPLAGLMVCCECGRNIVAAHFGGKRRTRICHARDTVCQKKSLPMDEVIEAFSEALQAYIADFEMKMEADDNTADREKHLLMISSMESELAKLDKKRKQLFADYEDRTYTRDEFIERKQHYNELIEELKKQVQAAQESIPEPVDYSEKIKTLHAMIDCVKDPNLSAKNKNDFLKQFVSTITYDAIDYGPKKGGKAVLEVFLK